MIEESRSTVRGRSLANSLAKEGITRMVSWGHLGIEGNGKSSQSAIPKDLNISLRVNPVGNGWLLRSEVAVMQRVVSMMTLKVSFRLETYKVV